MIVQELHQIQHEHGYLPEDQLRALSERIRQPLHRLHEVASFFPHYQLQPPPAAEVKVCCDMACHLAGGESLCRHLEEVGKQARGQQVSVKRVSCLGRCDGAPAVSINDQVYWNKSQSRTGGPAADRPGAAAAPQARNRPAQRRSGRSIPTAADRATKWFAAGPRPGRPTTTPIPARSGSGWATPS